MRATRRLSEDHNQSLDKDTLTGKIDTGPDSPMGAKIRLPRQLSGLERGSNTLVVSG